MTIGFTDGVSQFIPDKGLGEDSEAKVHKISFGDGYEQRTPKGINNLKQNYNLTFATRPKAEIDDITAFLETKQGTTNFSLTVPDSNVGGGERTIKVVAENWSREIAYDEYYTCTVQLRRVYEP